MAYSGEWQLDVQGSNYHRESASQNFFCGKENHERINTAAKRLKVELGVWGSAPEKFAFLTLNYAILYLF